MGKNDFVIELKTYFMAFRGLILTLQRLNGYTSRESSHTESNKEDRHQPPIDLSQKLFRLFVCPCLLAFVRGKDLDSFIAMNSVKKTGLLRMAADVRRRHILVVDTPMSLRRVGHCDVVSQPVLPEG